MQAPSLLADARTLFTQSTSQGCSWRGPGCTECVHPRWRGAGLRLSELSIFLDEAEGERNLPSWNPSLLRFQIPMPGMANVGYGETEIPLKAGSRQVLLRFSCPLLSLLYLPPQSNLKIRAVNLGNGIHLSPRPWRCSWPHFDSCQHSICVLVWVHFPNSKIPCSPPMQSKGERKLPPEVLEVVSQSPRACLLLIAASPRHLPGTTLLARSFHKKAGWEEG